MHYVRIEIFRNGTFYRIEIVPVESYDRDVIGDLVRKYGPEIRIYKCNRQGNNYHGRLIWPEYQ